MVENENGFLAPKNTSSTSMATTMTLTDPTAAAPVKQNAEQWTNDEKAELSTLADPVTPGDITEKSPEKPVKDEEKPHEYGEDNGEYPGMVALSLITLALCLAVFLVALDQTIIATAIPKITDDFRALDDVGWYGSAYMLTMCSFQLIFGKIYKFFSLKWCFLAAIGVFELGSLICGVAPSSEVLIIGRAVAGLGCSGIFSGALIILAHSVPLRQRPMYMGMIGAMFGIASVAGPLLGGVFTDSLTWRWCFYINLPVGAVTIIVIIIFFKPPIRDTVDKYTTKEKLAEFDFLGTFLLLPAVVSLLLALQWGGSKYAWKSGHIIGLIVTAAILLILFALVQFRAQETATLPPRIIKQRSIAFGSIVSLATASAFMVLVFYVPIWFQAIKGVSATKSGIMNLPLILGVTLLAILSGIGTTVVGYYVPFMIVGGALLTIGAGLLTTFNVDTPHPQWIGYQFLAGAGVGMVMQQPMIASQTVLKLDDVPTGTAAIVFFQSLGGALFISVGQNVFNNQLISKMMSIVPGISPEQLLQVGATSLKSAYPEDILPKILVAYNDSLTTAYTIAIAMGVVAFLGSLGMEWASVKGKKMEMVPA